MFSEAQVIDELRDAIAEYGSQKAFAKKAGVSVQFVNDVVRGRRPPTGDLLTALGFTCEIIYFPIPTGRGR